MTHINKKTIEDKLATLKYNCDSESHLIVNQEICKNCQAKYCTFICPANVYKLDEDGNTIKVEYENCLECGACKIACIEGAIDWRYPQAGCGVLYKYS